MLYNKKNPHGGDVYGGGIRLDFSANINPFGTPDSVIQAAADSLRFSERYPDPYARKLIAAIADYHDVPEGYVLAGAGAAEMIYCFCNAGKFRTALETAPTFSEYGLALRSCGAEVMNYPLSEERDFTLDRGILDYIRDKRPEAVFICNPNNPTGRLADPEIMKELNGLSRELDIRLFVDECFLELAEGISLKDELEGNNRLMIMKAFTKNYGMAGLRLGYVLSADPVILEEMSECVQPWNISIPAQAAGVQALRETDFLKKSTELIKTERNKLASELRMLGLSVIDSDVNFILFKGPEYLDQGMRERGILIRSCDNYCGLGKGWFRIAVKLPEENAEMLKVMRDVL